MNEFLESRVKKASITSFVETSSRPPSLSIDDSGMNCLLVETGDDDDDDDDDKEPRFELLLTLAGVLVPKIVVVEVVD